MSLFSSTKKRILIFSDLDGTILSSVDYYPGPSLRAVNFALKQGMELALVSSKARAEIEYLQNNFGWNFPFISENGGAIYIPEKKALQKRPKNFTKDGHFWKMEFGVTYDILCTTLRQIAIALQIKIMAFHHLTAEQVAELADLSLDQAKLAKMREFDEPFLVAEESVDKIPLLINEIERRGFRYTRGGRYHHITSDYDKGRAVKLVKELYQEQYDILITAAIGDAKNDQPMFQQVDYSFLVRKHDGTYENEAVIPNITITKGIGPHGFAEAIETLMNKSF